jgi:flagellar hook-length control protein FliK
MSDTMMLPPRSLPDMSRSMDRWPASKSAGGGADSVFGSAMREAKGRAADPSDAPVPGKLAEQKSSDEVSGDEAAVEQEVRDDATAGTSATDDAATEKTETEVESQPESGSGAGVTDDEQSEAAAAVDVSLVAAAQPVKPQTGPAMNKPAASSGEPAPPRPTTSVQQAPEPISPVAVVPEPRASRSATVQTTLTGEAPAPPPTLQQASSDGQSTTGDQQQRPTTSAALQMPGAAKGVDAAAAPTASPAAPATPVGDVSAAPPLLQNTAPSPAQAVSAQASATLATDVPDADGVNTARLARGLQSALAQQGGSVTLRLTPPDLGTVRIQLQVQAGQVSANFQAGNETARAMLNHQMMHLRTALEAQGLSVERLTVSPANQSPAGQLQQQGQQAGQQQSGNSGQPSQQQSATDGRSRGEYSQQQSQQQGDDRQRSDERDAPRRFTDWFRTDAFNPAA